MFLFSHRFFLRWLFHSKLGMILIFRAHFTIKEAILGEGFVGPTLSI